MPLTDAQRQKRRYHHRMGDHSFCDPKRNCPLDPEPVPLPDDEPEPTPRPSRRQSGFGPRGQELYDALKDVEMGPLHKALLVEACRLADRMDRFERTLSGGKWFFERRDEDDRVEIVIDNALSEARQYASAFKQIVAELEPKPTAGAGRKPDAPKIPTGVASLTKKLAERQKQLGG